MKTCGLIRFIQGDTSAGIAGCANYDKHYGGCLFGKDCKVESGQRCSYFEKAVLPTAADLGIMESIADAYSSKTHSPGLLVKTVKSIRKCGCGEVLKSRQRLCDRCSANRQRQHNREYAKRKRLEHRVTVES